MQTMLDKGAPSSEIEQYAQAEGVTPEMMRSGPNTSYTGALAKGLSDTLTGASKTIKALGGKGGTTDVLDASAKSTEPSNYQSASERFFKPGAGDTNVGGFAVNQIPRAVAEGAPAMAQDLGVTAIAAKLPGYWKLLAPVAGLASYGLRNFGQNLETRTESRTGQRGQEPSSGDQAVAAGQTLLEGGLNQLGVTKFLKPATSAATGVKGAVDAGVRMGQRAGIEAATNAAQDVVSQAGATVGTDKGVQIDPHRVIGSGILGGTTGAAFAVPGAIRDAGLAARYRDFDSGASTAVADRIQSHATAIKGDLSNTSVARQAVGAADSDIRSDLRAALKSDPASAVAIRNDAAARRAMDRLTAKEDVTDADFEAIDSAASQGSEIGNLARQAMTINMLKRKGTYESDPNGQFKGGLSDVMERGVRSIKYAPNSVTAAGLTGLGLSAAAGGIPFTASLGALGSVYGGYLGARFVADPFLGLRSPANTFVNKFKSDPNALQAAPQGGTNTPPPAAPNGPPTSGVPLVPPRPPMPWGNPSAPPQPQGTPVTLKNLAGFRMLLDSAVKAENRDYRDSQKAERDQRAQTIGEAMPLLRRLASQSNAGDPNSTFRQQMKEASDLVAARRANEKLTKTRAPPVEKVTEDAPPVTESPSVSPPPPEDTFQFPTSDTWHLSPKERADAAFKTALEKGMKIFSAADYKGRTEQRIKIKEGALFKVVKELSPEDQQVAQPYFEYFDGAGSKELAKTLRQKLKESLSPEGATTVDKYFTDMVIDKAWKK